MLLLIVLNMGEMHSCSRQTVAVLGDQRVAASEREWLERLTGIAVPRAVDRIIAYIGSIHAINYCSLFRTWAKCILVVMPPPPPPPCVHLASGH